MSTGASAITAPPVASAGSTADGRSIAGPGPSGGPPPRTAALVRQAGVRGRSRTGVEQEGGAVRTVGTVRPATPGPEGGGPGRADARGGTMRLSDENLRGRAVIGSDGREVGEVAALFLDSEAWSVESLQVKLRKDVADQLGAARTVFHAGTVEVPVRLIQSVSDAIVLAVPVDGLREVLPAVPGEGASVATHEGSSASTH